MNCLGLCILVLLTTSIAGCNQLNQDKKVSIEGLFTKGFETYELKKKSGEALHVFDPHHYLDPLVVEGFKNKSGKKMWLTIPVCVKGELSTKGQYGHMGSYERQIEITGLCK